MMSILKSLLCLLLAVCIDLLVLVVALKQQDTPLPNYFGLDDNFQANLRQTLSRLDNLERPFLIHDQDSYLVFRNGSQTINISIPTTTYENLKVISHLPVTAVSLLIPEALSDEDFVTMSTREKLIDFMGLVMNLSSVSYNSNSTYQQSMRQQQWEIINGVLGFLTGVLDRSINISLDNLKNFVNSLNSQLEAIAKDAVKDYLICLDQTIVSLRIPQKTLKENLVVVLLSEQFSQIGSFLHQYYVGLLNIENDSERLILQHPSSACSSSANCSEMIEQYQPLLYKITLFQTISKIFNNDSFSSNHKSLSQVATEVICSANLAPQSNCSSEIIVQGFHTRYEKGYVIVMMISAGIAVLLGIVLGCITYEDRLMASERKTEESRRKFKLDGPNVFTPVNSVEADTEAPSTETPGRHTLTHNSDSST